MPALALAGSLIAASGAGAADLMELQRPPTFLALDQNLWVVTVTATVQATPSFPGSERVYRHRLPIDQHRQGRYATPVLVARMTGSASRSTIRRSSTPG